MELDKRIKSLKSIRSFNTDNKVYVNNTIKPAFPEISQTIPRHKEYLEAIEKVITYLEILGFRNDH